MNGLFIDTATELGSVALYQNEKLLYTIHFANNLNHLQTLHRMVKQILMECNLSIEQINYYGVDIGPGSFTGIRIGVTAARTLCQLTNSLIYGACSLDILAQKVPYFSGLIVPMIDGKKNAIYTSFYVFENSKIKQIHNYMDIQSEELINRVNQYHDKFQEVLFLGDGQKNYQQSLTSIILKSHFTGIDFFYPYAEDIFPLCDHGKLTKNYEGIKPFYLRKSEAETIHSHR